MSDINKTPKITFYIPDNECTSLKIMCVLTHSTMSNFIRCAIKDKIKQLKTDTNNLDTLD